MGNGMKYASFVEAKGYDVNTSPQMKAGQELNKFK